MNATWIPRWLVGVVGLLVVIGRVPAAAHAAPAAEEIALVQPDYSLVLLRGQERRRIGSSGPTICWSPDGWRLAQDNGIWTFGTKPTAAPAFSPIFAGTAQWSPDGQRLAWHAGVDFGMDFESAGIAVAGPDGDAARLITKTRPSDDAPPLVIPDWSPDGGSVMFGGYRVATGLTIPAQNRLRNPNSGWSADGQRYAWVEAEWIQGGGYAFQVLVREAGRTTTRAIIRLRGPLTDEMMRDTWQPRWLANGSILLPLSNPSLITDSGTWLIQPSGTYRKFSPYVLTDLAPDGQRFLARSANATDERTSAIVIVRVADGVIERRVGPGIYAAWRPQLRGPAPAAPLAARSPALQLKTPRMRGAAVREAQHILTALGYSTGSIDGIYGPGTAAAVTRFQLDHDDQPVGAIDAEEWAWLRRAALIQNGSY